MNTYCIARRLVALAGIGMVAAALAATPVSAQDWGVILNGKSIHINSSRDWNEENWGLGLEREFDTQSRWVKVALVNGFKDSAAEMSYMAGGGLKRRFRLPVVSEQFFVDIGVVGFLMSRADVDGGRPFPGLLPALTAGTPRAAINLTFLSESMMDSATSVSRVDPTVSGLVFVQLKLHPSLLGLGGRRSSGRAPSLLQ